MLTLRHEPVMLNESVSSLITDPAGVYIDGTFGGGGHSNKILQSITQAGRLICIDCDAQAFERAQKLALSDGRVSSFHANFATLSSLVSPNSVQGILLDLGLSSLQLDDSQRGFSFTSDSPLDMRLDTSKGETAEQWLQHTSEVELARAFFEYGDEKHSRAIAKAIVRHRQQGEPLATTKHLTDLVLKSLPAAAKYKKNLKTHPATKVFLVVRMAVNRELESIQLGLEAAYVSLREGGRLAIISFQSTEDRIVKHHFSTPIPPMPARRVPLPPSSFKAEGAKWKSVIKMCKPSLAEIQKNPRARSAILRVAEKVAA